MALYDLPRMTTVGNPLSGRLNALVTAVLAWNDARQTRKALSSLSSRELDDIGLIRGDIDTISRHSLR